MYSFSEIIPCVVAFRQVFDSLVQCLYCFQTEREHIIDVMILSLPEEVSCKFLVTGLIILVLVILEKVTKGKQEE